MNAKTAADQCFNVLRFMLHNGIIGAEQHEELQEKVNRWAELPDESQAYGTCANGHCEF